tara:strand:- start:5361 stop:5507 length:147 start_codon:yes stop_codon:yes gene_type:complete
MVDKNRPDDGDRKKLIDELRGLVNRLYEENDTLKKKLAELQPATLEDK